ncbi:MAG: chemotaxis protein CheW [Desulfobacterales bacterium]|nr:MAG: chemotaxis protein CheW [Desulfobacterales bacterium]
MQNIVLFQAGTRQFGIGEHRISGIEAMSKVVPGKSPSDTPRALLIEGRNIPFYDLAELLGEKAGCGRQSGQKILIVNGKTPLTLLVDRVDGVVETDEDHIALLPPVFKGPALSCFPSVLRMERQLILIVDPEQLGCLNELAAEAKTDRSVERQAPDSDCAPTASNYFLSRQENALHVVDRDSAMECHSGEATFEGAVQPVQGAPVKQIAENDDSGLGQRRPGVKSGQEMKSADEWVTKALDSAIDLLKLEPMLSAKIRKLVADQTREMFARVLHNTLDSKLAKLKEALRSYRRSKSSPCDRIPSQTA